jgi:hypothetical protein
MVPRRMLKIRPKENKQAKLQWLQDPSEINGDNLNKRRETSRHFRNKKGQYLIDELATSSKTRTFRDTCIDE